MTGLWVPGIAAGPQDEFVAVVVPVGSIKRIELDRAAAERGLLGFSVLDEPE